MHIRCLKRIETPTTSLRGALATRQSIPPSTRSDGLLRGACHRAGIRPTRWLAMTAQNNGEHNMPARQNWFDGWRLFALLSLTLLSLSIWIAGMRGFEVDGVRMVIRFTARTSLVLF